MNTKIILAVCLIALLSFSCSSSQESASENNSAGEQEIYVFDDIDQIEPAVEETVEQEPTPSTIETAAKSAITEYVVQVGAFTDEPRAQEFVKEKQKETEHPMSISFSSVVQLYVVQLPPFSSRVEAESVRNKLWATKKFEDAFILTVDK